VTKEELTQEELKQLLHYNSETGIFTWKERPNNSFKSVKGTSWNVKFAGKITGSLNTIGYLTICINNKAYYAHRLAWLYVYGYFPKDKIDHINGIKKDNRIENLRECNNSENFQNLKTAKSHNKSGFLGVSFHRDRNKYFSRIVIDRKMKNLGYFETAIEAHFAYLESKRKIHPFGTL